MIIFLDFDGVLHPVNRPDGAFTLIKPFENLMCDFPNIDIVISSSWREQHNIAELRSLFSSAIQMRIVDITPIMNHLEHKFLYAEIVTWMREEGREYEGWVALDDSEWLFPPSCPNLILVDPVLGFDRKIEDALRRKFLTS